MLLLFQMSVMSCKKAITFSNRSVILIKVCLFGAQMRNNSVLDNPPYRWDGLDWNGMDDK